MTIREYLFHNFTGCSNHGCVITGEVLEVLLNEEEGEYA
jgi:hypothetical protein